MRYLHVKAGLTSYAIPLQEIGRIFFCSSEVARWVQQGCQKPLPIILNGRPVRVVSLTKQLHEGASHVVRGSRLILPSGSEEIAYFCDLVPGILETSADAPNSAIAGLLEVGTTSCQVYHLPIAIDPSIASYSTGEPQ
jgi:hypothetical protein